MNEYTVQIECSNEDGTIWQAMAPSDNVTAGSAEEAAWDVADNQNIAEGNNWRVLAWDGAGADTSADPDYAYYHDTSA